MHLSSKVALSAVFTASGQHGRYMTLSVKCSSLPKSGETFHNFAADAKDGEPFFVAVVVAYICSQC